MFLGWVPIHLVSSGMIDYKFVSLITIRKRKGFAICGVTFPATRQYAQIHNSLPVGHSPSELI